MAATSSTLHESTHGSHDYDGGSRYPKPLCFAEQRHHVTPPPRRTTFTGRACFAYPEPVRDHDAVHSPRLAVLRRGHAVREPPRRQLPPRGLVATRPRPHHRPSQRPPRRLAATSILHRCCASLRAASVQLKLSAIARRRTTSTMSPISLCSVRGHHPGVEFGLRVELQCQGAEHLLAVFCVSTSAATPRRSPRHAPPVLVAATGHGDRDQHFLLVTKSANSGSTAYCSRLPSLRSCIYATTSSSSSLPPAVRCYDQHHLPEARKAALHLILGVAAQQHHHFIIDTICVRPLCRECCPAFVPWKFSCREAANPTAMFQGKPQQPSTSL